jgi:hypothetical protein
MAQHVPNGDWANQGFQQDMRRVPFFDDHPFPELRYKPGDGIIQADFTFVHQHHRSTTA